MTLKGIVLPAAIALGLAVSACANAQDSPDNDPALLAAVETGTLLGVREDGVRVFKSIPYAAPPVGDLRWRAPEPPLTWDGVRDAGAFGPWCPQPDFQAVQALSGGDSALAERTLTAGGGIVILDTPALSDSNEDCLTLNVWAPEQAQDAPVIVWLHGGAGAGSQPYFNGSRFAQDGVVLVTLNFRMFTMGNFSHPALTAEASEDEPLTLYARLDQLAALRWVRDNIEAFGGDPANVTLAGQSAGGAAVVGLLATPAAEGLFHRAIIQSSSGFWAPFTHEEHEHLGSLLASETGLPGADATAAQLRSLPVDAFPWAGFHALDGRWWPEGPHEALAAGRIIDVPLIIGWNSFDGSSLRYSPEQVIANTLDEVLAAYPREGMSEQDLAYALYTDAHNGAPARWIAAQTADGAPSFLYHFSYVLSAARSSSPRGAEHGREIFHVFDSWSKIPQEELPPQVPNLEAIMTDQDRAMTRLLHDCWITFAATGEPDCEGAPDWPRYQPQEGELMEFGETVAVRRNFRKPQLDAQERAMDHIMNTQRTASSELIDQLERRRQN
ncbi:MAG: carboxylesterase family protein [Maricaulaceae bacterium]